MALDRSSYYADSSTPLALATITAAMADAEADQFDAREIHTYQWADSTARAAETGMVEGDMGYQADTDTYYKYSGSAWGLLATGLAAGAVMMRSLSVTCTGTSASMDANGVVTFTSCTVVTVYGLSADFDQYKVDLNSIGTAASAILQLTDNSGAANTSAVYDRTELLGRNGTPSSSTSTAGTSWGVMGMANTNHQMSLELTGICAARATTLLGTAGVHANPAVSNTNNGVITQFCTHRNSTAYYGIKFTFTAAQTGTLRIRGTL